MRPMMFVILLAGTVYAQSMVENAAAAAGGGVGGMAGHTVGNGLANIFDKVNQTTTKAAKTGATRTKKKASADADDDPLMEVGPGVPKGPSVPPPPPVHRAAHRAVRDDVPDPPAPVVRAAPVREVTPAKMTVRELQKIAVGTGRAQVLQLGEPAVRISQVDDDGHFIELYRYMAKDTTIGAVQLIDGSVASVLVR